MQNVGTEKKKKKTLLIIYKRVMFPISKREREREKGIGKGSCHVGSYVVENQSLCFAVTNVLTYDA
jgi:hypothetical protein